MRRIVISKSHSKKEPGGCDILSKVTTYSLSDNDYATICHGAPQNTHITSHHFIVNKAWQNARQHMRDTVERLRTEPVAMPNR